MITSLLAMYIWRNGLKLGLKWVLVNTDRVKWSNFIIVQIQLLIQILGNRYGIVYFLWLPYVYCGIFLCVYHSFQLMKTVKLPLNMFDDVFNVWLSRIECELLEDNVRNPSSLIERSVGWSNNLLILFLSQKELKWMIKVIVGFNTRWFLFEGWEVVVGRVLFVNH